MLARGLVGFKLDLRSGGIHSLLLTHLYSQSSLHQIRAIHTFGADSSSSLGLGADSSSSSGHVGSATGKLDAIIMDVNVHCLISREIGPSFLHNVPRTFGPNKRTIFWGFLFHSGTYLVQIGQRWRLSGGSRKAVKAVGGTASSSDAGSGEEGLGILMRGMGSRGRVCGGRASSKVRTGSESSSLSPMSAYASSRGELSGATNSIGEGIRTSDQIKG